MKNRTIKELLELMLEHQHLFSAGLCLWNTSMHVRGLTNWDEYLILKKYINNHSPFLNIFNSSPYYWKSGDINPRIKWIKKHIKQNTWKQYLHFQ